MDLSKMKDDQKLNLCRWYFKGGIVCLPFLWWVNAIWFFREAFKRDPYEEQKEIRKYVIMSGILGLAWLAAIIAWITVYQTHRASWGEFGENLSFVIPTGKP